MAGVWRARGIPGPFLHWLWRMERRWKNASGQVLENFPLDQRRTVANEACDAGRVLANGKPARASYEVKAGDVLEIHLGERVLKAEVLSVAEYAKKEQASDLYRLLEE